MGQYNKAVLTTAGEKIIARALAGEIKLNITKAKTSDFAYPENADLKRLTDMQGVRQTVRDPETVVFNETIIQTRVLFSNEDIASTYYIHNIGLYAMDGTHEVLFSIVTAEMPDEMPQYNGVASTSYIYNIQNVVQDAAQLNISVNPSGTATIQDVLERVDATGGDISETVIETLETAEDKYPVPAAGESVKRFFGKLLTFISNIRPLTGNINIYVSTTGSDTTGDGTISKPFKTIQHAINILPKDLGGYTVIITVTDGTYPEVVKIVGFTNGEFRLYSSHVDLLSDNCKIDRIIAQYNTCLLVVGGFSIMTTTADGIFADSCPSLNFQFMKITENAISTGKVGMSIFRSIFSIWNCQVSYHNVALLAYNSRGVSNNWATCVGNNYGLYSSYGAVVALTGTQPAATTSVIHDTGGSFTHNNGTQIAGIFTGLSCTWGTIYGGYVRHGNYDSGSNAMITVNIKVVLTTNLSAGITYSISGFPKCESIPLSVPISVSVHDKRDIYFCALNTVGTMEVNLTNPLTAGQYLIFTCTYFAD